jgi:hypothetical protein
MLLVSRTQGQEANVSVQLDTNQALIGDQLKLHILVEKPADMHIGFPVYKKVLPAEIEITELSGIDSVEISPGIIKFSQDLSFTVFDTGFFEIPVLDFLAELDAKKDTLKSNSLYFEIKPVKLDAGLRDIKANYRAPVTLAELYPYILFAIVVGLLGWLLVWYVRRRYKHKPLFTREVPPEAPEVVAIRELKQLNEEQLWQRKQVKVFYIKLTGIVRTYLERRYKIMALEQTSFEILAALKQTDCKPAERKTLEKMLILADMVKFAKAIPDDAENAVQVDIALEFVNKTTPVARENLKEKDKEKELLQESDYTVVI